MSRDWRAWHTAYDADTPLAQRLVIVQRAIADVLDAAPPGLIRAVSMCTGEGRDLLGVLPEHPRAGDVRARLVELDPELATRARASAPATVEVVCADAAETDVYAGAVPANVVLVCGVFGNIPDDDIQRTIRTLPSLCAAEAFVIWTRHRRPPDRTIDIRRWFAEAGFETH
ncbi:MAG TPA: class I SAM-dependent methyltransferase, partial [Acidimicrobiia bacterium]|nr:class I SAM-dependent methyltransferase [Acidimicrobiia bacterium]